MAIPPQVGPPPLGVQNATLQLSINFFPLAFLFLFCTPVASINGHAQQVGWGNHEFDVPPGRYHVRIYFPYLFTPECGANEIEVHLRPGEFRRVKYYMWPLVFLPGSISVE